MYKPYKTDDISSNNTLGVKKAQPSKVESYLEVNECMDRLVTARSDIRI